MGGTETKSDERTSAGSPAPAAEAPDAAAEAALRDAMSRLGELKEYASYFVAAKVDQYKVSAQKAAISKGIGVAAAVVACAAIVTAVVLLLGGMAEGVGALAVYWIGPGWQWLGPTIVGLIVLSAGALGALLGPKWLSRRTRAKLVAKYAERRRRQRAKYGHDVAERAREHQDEPRRCEAVHKR